MFIIKPHIKIPLVCLLYVFEVCEMNRKLFCVWNEKQSSCCVNGMLKSLWLDLQNVTEWLTLFDNVMLPCLFCKPVNTLMLITMLSYMCSGYHDWWQPYINIYIYICIYINNFLLVMSTVCYQPFCQSGLTLHWLCCVTLWGLNKMDAILQTTFSNAFFVKEKFCILFQNSVAIVPPSSIDKESTLCMVMLWCRTSNRWSNVDKPVHWCQC